MNSTETLIFSYHGGCGRRTYHEFGAATLILAANDHDEKIKPQKSEEGKKKIGIKFKLHKYTRVTGISLNKYKTSLIRYYSNIRSKKRREDATREKKTHPENESFVFSLD